MLDIKRLTQILDRQVSALFAVLAEIHGTDQLVLKAGKLDSNLMRSEKLEERVLARTHCS